MAVPSARRHRFPREYRLKRQRLIRPLFDRDRPEVGQLREGPVVVRYRIVERSDVGVDVALQVGFAVGLRAGHRPARNRVKRIMREVFRHHHHGLEALFAHSPNVLTLMVLYRGRTEEAQPAISASLPVALQRLANQLDAARSNRQMNPGNPSKQP